MLALLFSAAIAQQPPAPEPRVAFEDVSRVDFEDPVEVNGELVKPRVNPVFEQLRKSFNPLMRPRTSFDREIRLSVDEVR